MGVILSSSERKGDARERLLARLLDAEFHLQPIQNSAPAIVFLCRDVDDPLNGDNHSLTRFVRRSRNKQVLHQRSACLTSARWCGLLRFMLKRASL